MTARVLPLRRPQHVAVHNLTGAGIERNAEPAVAPVIATPNDGQLNDIQREIEIELARQRMLAAPHLSSAAYAQQAVMILLIVGRSAVQVMSMEVRAGLTAPLTKARIPSCNRARLQGRVDVHRAYQKAAQATVLSKPKATTR